MSTVEKNKNSDTNALSISRSDANGTNEAKSRESSYFQMKTFCLKWGGGLGVCIVLAWCHLLAPLPAKAANGSSTSHVTSSMQGLPKEKQRGQGQGPSSTTQRLPIENIRYGRDLFLLFSLLHILYLY